MNSYPKISVITVCYNSAKTIEQTIASVVNQTYQNIEYIIIDGGSTDGTVDIIKKYEDKIAYWVSETDKGIYDAMNKGIKIASGDYIQIIGADDSLINSRTIESIVKELDESAQILSTGIFMVDENLKLQIYAGNKIARNRELYDGSMIPHPGLFVKSEIMKEFLFNTTYKSAADYEFFLKCYLSENIVFKYIDLPTVFFSLGGTSSSSSIGKKEHIAIMKKVGFDKKVIDELEANQNDSLRTGLKMVLGKIGLLYLALRLKGWEKHYCSWNKCRWCKKNDL